MTPAEAAFFASVCFLVAFLYVVGGIIREERRERSLGRARRTYLRKLQRRDEGQR